jgi:putative membrane protein
MNEDTASDSPKPKLNANTRLAYERTFLAHERTQLGWIRTALSLISFGFAIAKFFEALREQHRAKEPLLAPRSVGILMISIGLLSLVLSDFQHRRARKAMRKEYPDLPTSVAGITGAFIALLGILALLGALFRE